MNADKLYLFKPSKGWEYCGGATIICAASLEDALEMGNRLAAEGQIAEICPHEKDVFAEDDSKLWAFVEEFTLKEPRPVGLVFTDANYA